MKSEILTLKNQANQDKIWQNFFLSLHIFLS